MVGQAITHHFGRGPPKDHHSQVWLNVIKWFLRKKDLNVNTYEVKRTPRDDKSSLGQWSGKI